MGKETIISTLDYGPTEGVESVSFFTQGYLKEHLGAPLNGKLVHLVNNDEIISSFTTRRLGGVDGSYLFDGVQLGIGAHILYAWFPTDTHHESSRTSNIGIKVKSPEEAEEADEKAKEEPLLSRIPRLRGRLKVGQKIMSRMQ